MSEINIAYSLKDENFCALAIVSMISVLVNNKKSSVNFYIMHDETIEDKYLKMFDLIHGYDNLNKIEFVPVEYAKYSKLVNYDNYLKHFYLFDLCERINIDRVLYLANNSVVNCDLRDLYNTDLSENSCAAAEHIYSKTILDNISYKKDFVFNSDVFLINTKLWREKKYYEKFFAKQLKDINIPGYKFNEIEVYNVLIDDCKKLDYRYNYSELNGPKNNKEIFCSIDTHLIHSRIYKHIESPLIATYLYPLPIDSGCQNTYASLWWKYAEMSPILDKIKDFRASNQYKLKATSASNAFNYAWLLSRMFPYIKPYLFRIFLGFAISIPLGLLDGVTALALKPYMDYVIGGKSYELTILNHSFSISSLLMAFLIPVGIILFAGIQGILRYLNSYISAWTSRRITNDVKIDLFHRLIHMHPQFFDDNPSGIVISRYVNDPATASTGIVDQIKTITTSICGALGLIAVMLYSSWQLAFIGVTVLLMAFIPVTLLRKRMRKASNENMVISGNITTNMNETYNGNKVMYAYDLQDLRENDFKYQIKQSFDVNMSLTKRTAWMSPLMYMISSCGIAAVLGVGTYLINKGQMTAGSFASFVTSLLLLYKPVKTLGGTLTGIQKIFVAMGRVFELFDLEPLIKDCENPKEFKELKDKITFEDVCFEYVPNKPVLKHINLEVHKNETLALVGNSGGGKSTLVNLINRFYEVKSGAVKYDGTDIREFSLKSLRGSISMVFQDNFLYSGTIKDNILMGKPGATTEEIEKAIEYAHLNEMIEKLPEGLETIIGERGLTLSGGQRQRVAIARAMLRNAPIVILDEATSALDNESEAIVQKAMDNLMKDRTVFIIAHRLSTIKNADRIAVINEGELAELGTHEELMQIENCQYKHLYEMQFRQQEQETKV